jgi:hypothetical protein
MLGSINPVVYGNTRRRESIARAGFHLLGTSLSSAVVAALMLASPWGPGDLGLLGAVAVVLVGLLALADAARVRLRVRQVSWQVPPSWRDRYPAPWGYPLLWGLMLGLGFTTIVPSSALYAIALSWIVWPQFAALAFLVFGVFRGLSVFVGQFASTERPAAEIVTAVWRLTEPTRLANSVACAAVAVTMLSPWR